MKAWRTEAMGITSLVYADLREEARWDTVRAAREAGYNVSYTEVHVTRAPQHDGPIASFQRRKCLCWLGDR